MISFSFYSSWESRACTLAVNTVRHPLWNTLFPSTQKLTFKILWVFNDDDISSQLQSKGIFYFWIYSGRVLSIHSDPCQALTTKQTKMKNYRKWKWEIAKLVSKSQILNLAFPTISTKSKASCQAPLVFTKCGDAWNHNFDFDKNWIPSPTTPPTPRAPPAGLFASSPAPQNRSLSSGGTSSLVTNKQVSKLAI